MARTTATERRLRTWRQSNNARLNAPYFFTRHRHLSEDPIYGYQPYRFGTAAYRFRRRMADRQMVTARYGPGSEVARLMATRSLENLFLARRRRLAAARARRYHHRGFRFYDAIGGA